MEKSGSIRKKMLCSFILYYIIPKVSFLLPYSYHFLLLWSLTHDVEDQDSTLLLILNFVFHLHILGCLGGFINVWCMDNN